MQIRGCAIVRVGLLAVFLGVDRQAPSAAPAVPRMPEHVLHATSTKAEPVKTATAGVEAAALPQALEPRVRSARVEETNPPPHSAHVPTEANTAHGEHAALYAWLNDWGLTESAGAQLLGIGALNPTI